MSKRTRTESSAGSSGLSVTWQELTGERSSPLQGYRPALEAFMPDHEWDEVFFRVEHVDVAALLPLDDEDLAEPIKRDALPVVTVKGKAKVPEKVAVLHTAVGKAIIRADRHVRVFKLVAKDNTLVTHLQWAHAALAVWHRLDERLRLADMEPPRHVAFPKGFLVAADTLRGGAEVKMTFGPSAEYADALARVQMPIVDVVAHNSYDQSVALSLSPAFRIVSSEPWFQQSCPYLRTNDEDRGSWGKQSHGRGVEHYIPASFVVKLTGQERTALVRAYFDALQMPLERVARDNRHDAIQALLDVCAPYIARESGGTNASEREPAVYTDEAVGFPEAKTAKGREVQKQLREMMHQVGPFIGHLKALANQSLGAAHKLPLVTAVMYNLDKSRSGQVLSDDVLRRLGALRYYEYAWRGLSVWQRSISHGSPTADTLLEALFVMVVHREHLQALFGLSSTEFDERVDKFVTLLGSAPQGEVMSLSRRFEPLSQQYFGRVL